MEHLLYAAVILALCVTFAVFLGRQRQALEKACEEREAIEVEEHRMFQFLHGLGESLQEDNSAANMHRYIVNGVAEVVGADGGILYLLDGRDQSDLVPVFSTKRAAPVVALPGNILKMEGPRQLRALRSHLQLTAVPRGNGLLGEALRSGHTLHVDKLLDCPAFDGPPNPLQEDLSVMLAPLVYGHKELGVIAVVRDSGRPFTPNDRDVFSSIAEQSSFALGSALIHSEAHEKRLLEDELRRASEIQRVLLPKKPPGLRDYRLASSFQAARLVSGDYLDYVPVDGHCYGVAIGDVCGKGIAASLIMTMCRTTLRGNAPGNLSPASVLKAVNRAIFHDIREDMFVSLVYLTLTKGSGEIRLARAGHEPPLLWRKATGAVETIEPPGMAAGIDDGEVFDRSLADHPLHMDSGDLMLLYTDGVTEAADPKEEEFGLERLREVLGASASGGASAVVDAVRGEVARFAGGATQSDDITLIAIEKR